MLIFLLMEAVILVVKPAANDFAWYQGLKRPGWLSLLPSPYLIWMLIQISFYISCLVSWHKHRSWPLVAAYVLLLLLAELRTWLVCRRRRLSSGAMLHLIGWSYGLVLTTALLSNSPVAALLLTPYLAWVPIEALLSWQMGYLNARR